MARRRGRRWPGLVLIAVIALAVALDRQGGEDTAVSAPPQAAGPQSVVTARVAIRDRPDALLVSADGRTVQVAGPASLSVVDAASRTVTATVPVRGARSLWPLPGGRVLVGLASGDVDVYEPATGQVRPLLQRRVLVAAARDRSVAYVLGQSPVSNGLVRLGLVEVDLTAGTSRYLADVPSAIDAAVGIGGRLFVTTADEHLLAVDPGTGTTTTLPIRAASVATSPTGRHLVAAASGGVVSVVDTSTFDVLTSTTVGQGRAVVAAGEDRSLILDGSKLLALDHVAGARPRLLAADAGPGWRLAPSPDGRTVWVAGNDGLRALTLP